jgi:hypothetical protein
VGSLDKRLSVIIKVNLLLNELENNIICKDSGDVLRVLFGEVLVLYVEKLLVKVK